VNDVRPGDLARLADCSVVWLAGTDAYIQAQHGDEVLVLAVKTGDLSVLLLTRLGRAGWLHRADRASRTAWVVRVER
jgi:hypothetical protein